MEGAEPDPPSPGPRLDDQASLSKPDDIPGEDGKPNNSYAEVESNSSGDIAKSNRSPTGSKPDDWPSVERGRRNDVPELDDFDSPQAPLSFHSFAVMTPTPAPRLEFSYTPESLSHHSDIDGGQDTRDRRLFQGPTLAQRTEKWSSANLEAILPTLDTGDQLPLQGTVPVAFTEDRLSEDQEETLSPLQPEAQLLLKGTVPISSNDRDKTLATLLPGAQLSSTAIRDVLACVSPDDIHIFDPLFFNEVSVTRFIDRSKLKDNVAKVLIPIYDQERQH